MHTGYESGQVLREKIGFSGQEMVIGGDGGRVKMSNIQYICA